MDRTKSRGVMWGLLALVVTIGLLGSALAGGSALAAKGGNSATGCKGGPKHGCGGTTTTATLTVSPNPVPLGSTSITISGSGFAANQVVYLDVSGWFPTTPVTMDANGSFTLFYAHVYTGGGNSFVHALNVDGTVLATANYTVCFTSTC